MTTKASISYTKFKFEENDTILFGEKVQEFLKKSIK